MEETWIEPFQPADSDNSLLLAVARLRADIEEEIRPGLPPPPLEEYIAQLRSTPQHRAFSWWIARTRDAECLGYSRLAFKRVGENPTSARFEVFVSSAFRRKGLGTALLSPLLDAARACGRTDLTCTARDRGSGAEFLNGIGAHCRGKSVESHLRIDQVDQSRLQEMLSDYRERHSGYRLTEWQNLCPEGIVEELAKAKAWMNTVPKGTRRAENWEISPTWIRAEESWRVQQQLSWWTISLSDSQTGGMVAFTDVIFSSYRPWIAMHEDVAVDPPHRRLGLAGHLYCLMLLDIYTRRPGVRILTTTNTSVNAPVLKINQRFGLVPQYEFGKWELGVSNGRIATRRAGESGKVVVLDGES